MTALSDECFDVASLEAFIGELVGAGFEPIEGSGRQRWRGPIHEAFAPLTDAETMDIAIAQGWPFQPPLLLVAGLNTNHSTLGGLVCMWREGDASLRWTTVKGLFARIEEWCGSAADGWENDDLGQDALLNFRRKVGVIATFDLAALGTTTGGWNEFHGVVNADPLRVWLGFRQMKSMSEEDGIGIMAARGNGYRSLEDVWRKAGTKPRVLQALAEADAFGSLGISRRDAIWAASAIASTKPLPLFASDLDGEAVKEPAAHLPEMTPGEHVVEDYVTMRLTLRAHPIAFLRHRLTPQAQPHGMQARRGKPGGCLLPGDSSEPSRFRERMNRPAPAEGTAGSSPLHQSSQAP